MYSLFSSSDIQSIVKKAIVERLKEHYRIGWFEEDGDSSRALVLSNSSVNVSALN